MRKLVLIAKNIEREGPGLLELALAQHGIRHTIVNLDTEPFPNPQNHSAVIVLGGPDSADDGTPKMKGELQGTREILSAGIPYLGIDLGMQVLVKAAGGDVYASDHSEIGWKDTKDKYFTMELTQHARNDPLFRGVPYSFPVFQLHNETVRLRGGMILLANEKHGMVQAVRVGTNAYGIQGHLELTQQLLDLWLEQDPELQFKDKAMLRLDYQSIDRDYGRQAHTILFNFLRVARLI